jgi:sterol desaturase/sphingolipid hydroxylase (fatty acid hydroxylase superfamily)
MPPKLFEETNPLSFFVQAFPAQAINYFILVTVVFWVVWKFGRKAFRRSKIPVRPRLDAAQLRREIGNSLITLAVGTLNALAIASLYRQGLTRLVFPPAALGFWQNALTFLLMISLSDTWFYWTHRLMHHPRVFRFVHITHHKSVEVNPYSSYSFHFLEAFILGAWIYPALMLVPVSILVLGVLQVAGLANNIMSHLGYEFYPRWFMRFFPFRMLNSATFHSLQHTTLNGNYGLFFRFWDRLMGTEVKSYEQVFTQRGATEEQDALHLS